MKVLLLSLFLFFCQNFSSTAQNANKDYAKWQHPVLQQLRANDKNIVPFYNKDSTAFVTVSAIDTKQNMIYWFNCYGYYFDAVPISEENKTALLKKTISPFKYYNLITSQYIKAVNIGRKKLQANGNNAKFTAYEKQLFQIDDTLKFPSTLTKLIDLDKQVLSVEMQLLQFNGTSPKYIKKDTSYNKTMDIKYGTVQTSYLPDTTSIYYNRIAIAPVYKAIVNHKKASIAYYSRKEELIEELQLNKTRLNSLLKEKTDVFLLYRGWLEMQRFYISETIANCKTNLKQNTRTGTEASSKSATTTKEKSAYQSMLKYANTLLQTVDIKIDYATNLDEEFVTQVIREEYEPTIPPEPVVSTMTRGNKKYELTDHRGNVMAVVTDRKIAVSSNGVTVDYYEADVVSATDYAPFGSALPGRSYSSENYRYGFNGKENDKDISEGGQDYGMRIYDARLGRFLSVDPLQVKYPSLSPYLYAINNPIVMIDREGADAKISITYNKDGIGIIKVQTVVHVTAAVKGATEDWRVKTYNSYVGGVYNSQTVNVEGKVWNIEYDIKYVYDKSFDATKLKEGENLMEVDPKTSKYGSNRTHVNGVRNNTGKMAPEHRKDKKVMYHETGHFIGFEDQYTEINAQSPEFEQYLRSKYNSKEDLAPGGTLYQMLQVATSDKGESVTLINVGYEKNEMSTNEGGFTDDQNKALVNAANTLSNGKDGTYLLKGFFDKKGKPSEGDLKKAFEQIENRIKNKINETSPQPVAVPAKSGS
jgi:RHS repeat-associated protein